jgi:uncharacterized membrane-anchored protein YhcB (DUF1043 family)
LAVVALVAGVGIQALGRRTPHIQVAEEKLQRAEERLQRAEDELRREFAKAA